MNGKFQSQRYPANWHLRFVCNCRKHAAGPKIYPATAKQLSINGTSIQSSHNVCPNTSITLQLNVPPTADGEPARIIEIIGRTLYTILESNHFFTEIEFLKFDKASRKMLLQALNQHFGAIS